MAMVITYHNEITRDARAFLVNNADIIVTGLAEGCEFDRNDVGGLDDAFHSDVIDTSYTLMDAAWVLDNCTNEETDSGLWESMSPRDAVCAQAAYSFANDVWSKCEEMYMGILKKLNEKFPFKDDTDMEADTDEVDGMGDDDVNPMRVEVAKDLLEQLRLEGLPHPVEAGSDDERELVDEWLQESDRAGMRGGYPMGASYIDARCGVGYGQLDHLAYIRLDEQAAIRMPHLSGKYREHVVQYRNDTFGTTPAPGI